MSKVIYKQGDIVYMDFSPAVGFEMEGTHPAVVVSNDRYNRNTEYLMVVPITSGGTYFNGYVNLLGYENVYGRVNATCSTNPFCFLPWATFPRLPIV